MKWDVFVEYAKRNGWIDINNRYIVYTKRRCFLTPSGNIIEVDDGALGFRLRLRKDDAWLGGW